MNLVIRGHSDDIVSIEGDISEEFYPNTDEAFFVVVSDGTALRITYDNGGMWRIKVLNKGNETQIDHHEGQDEDTDYSDIVTLTSSWDIEWIVGGKGLFPRKKGR